MPSKEILKIRDGTLLESEGILTYRKRPSKLLGLAQILWPSKEILKIGDDSGKPSQEILKIRDGTPLEWHEFWFSRLGHLKKF
ncbi:hypothetical protein OROGR_011586 [Orobanche gracilis]